MGGGGIFIILGGGGMLTGGSVHLYLPVSSFPWVLPWGLTAEPVYFQVHYSRQDALYANMLQKIGTAQLSQHWRERGKDTATL